MKLKPFLFLIQPHPERLYRKEIVLVAVTDAPLSAEAVIVFVRIESENFWFNKMEFPHNRGRVLLPYTEVLY